MISAALLIGIGWALWLAALWLPALRYHKIGSGFETVATGLDCFQRTIDVVTWWHALLTFAYCGANVVLFLSPIALFLPRRSGLLLLANVAALGLALTAGSFGERLLGAYVWTLSFFMASCGIALVWGSSFEESTPNLKCPACGFDLRGDPTAGCPECGWGRG